MIECVHSALDKTPGLRAFYPNARSLKGRSIVCSVRSFDFAYCHAPHTAPGGLAHGEAEHTYAFCWLAKNRSFTVQAQLLLEAMKQWSTERPLE